MQVQHLQDGVVRCSHIVLRRACTQQRTSVDALAVAVARVAGWLALLSCPTLCCVAHRGQRQRESLTAGGSEVRTRLGGVGQHDPPRGSHQGHGAHAQGPVVLPALVWRLVQLQDGPEGLVQPLLLSQHTAEVSDADTSRCGLTLWPGTGNQEPVPWEAHACSA